MKAIVAILMLTSTARSHVYGLRGGHWLWQGHFVDRPTWIVDSVLRFTRPDHVDSVVDLAGGYVVPPTS